MCYLRTSALTHFLLIRGGVSDGTCMRRRTRMWCRVDVSADGGRTWLRAELGQGALQPYGRAWAWTQWEVSL